MDKKSYNFWIMISVVAISGLSQGMLLPAIAMIFEKEGVSSSINGLHATAMYIGILVISPFLEKPMHRFGLKPIIVCGGLMVVASLVLFTQTFSFWIWFVLRFLIGVGDHMLHVGTQTWITSTSDNERLGRNVSIYGAFFGAGFALGPYLASTVQYGQSMPFIISSFLCFAGWLLLLPTKNTFPQQATKKQEKENMVSRYKKVLRIGWIALLAPFVYGLLEAMLHSNFPVYAMRQGFTIQQISFIVPAFAIGGIITQVPLGALSDRYGRGKLLTTIFLCSACVYIVGAFLDGYYWSLLAVMLVSGMVVGSCFSLGLGYMTDLVPKYLLPAGNILCGIAFSLGSIVGPIIGGIFIQTIKGISFFAIISILLFFVYGIYVVYAKKYEQVFTEAKAENM
ncbi:MFS transporter [Bacillus sp. 165]|uniref:MFS transporter n=1 Tax=Bacillus sp. 165 TaxID=1529117 RepID=UPI001ADADC45|nr:MFS transporter [Bacillus sp. 165]MBO9129194.1 MFS transporter [Bacillus sp. 165]